MFSITTIMENSTPCDNLAAEHGLSIFIEGESFCLLYDAGASSGFLANARKLGIDLGKADALVLSHGHYDHTGGVPFYLEEAKKPRDVYLGEGFFGMRFSKHENGLLDISARVEEKALLEHGMCIHVVKGQPVELSEGIWLVSGFTPAASPEKLSPRMLRCTGEALVTDSFTDETAVVLKTKKELALISGCSHIGVVNMCERVAGLFGSHVTTFIGGTHLMAADDGRIRYTCEALLAHGVRRLGACHCSGEAAGQYFEAHFPGFFRNRTGTRIVIE